MIAFKEAWREHSAVCAANPTPKAGVKTNQRV